MDPKRWWDAAAKASGLQPAETESEAAHTAPHARVLNDSTWRYYPEPPRGPTGRVGSVGTSRRSSPAGFGPVHLPSPFVELDLSSVRHG